MQKQQTQSHLMIESEAGVSPAPLHARFGHILAIEGDSVRVTFDGCDMPSGLAARLGRQFNRVELELAVQNALSCRIEFIGNDPNLPLVTDIFFSLIEQRDELVLKAKNIRIEAEEQLIVASRDAKTHYDGKNSRVTTEAKYINSQAEKSQKIQGAIIAIN
ncbi:hypothetical protein L6J37_19200 [Photobacterium sp. WH77]|uniref:Uncharacterized protein n=1 Tax=Photobacterium arenosum TaxID=2774143 RepID=A0ABR9BM91_9GAMM|nr:MULTISPECIES: hypothetical protein [Photobacterium]MBD8513663.1 hypothetical protein [Photobacterium arenosum]MBV7262756.1 hypothetical protein [Photobacterium sp. WH24]MCG2838963.1 hypothetical protein [Photobacterium sp. WH77]MCG2846580.1 hypothetical protein [Photobacterium sp. WH80]